MVPTANDTPLTLEAWAMTVDTSSGWQTVLGIHNTWTQIGFLNRQLILCPCYVQVLFLPFLHLSSTIFLKYKYKLSFSLIDHHHQCQ